MDKTIVLSNLDTRYLYKVNENDNKKSNEINVMEKNDDNLMDNEIISFVPTEEIIWTPTKKPIKTDTTTTEKTVKQKEAKDVTVKINISRRKEKKKNVVNMKNHIKRGRLLNSSLNVKIPTSLGVRSKPSSARKKLQRGREFRNTKGYHASSGPMDFLKKRYKSEYLEVRLRRCKSRFYINPKLYLIFIKFTLYQLT